MHKYLPMAQASKTLRFLLTPMTIDPNLLFFWSMLKGARGIILVLPKLLLFYFLLLQEHDTSHFAKLTYYGKPIQDDLDI